MTHETTPDDHITLEDTDFVDEPKQEAEPTPKVTAGHMRPYHLPFNKQIRPPSNPEDPGADTLERSSEWGTAFLRAVQQNLRKYSLKPGGKAVDFRSLKHWNTSISGPDMGNPVIDQSRERQWNALMEKNGSFFDQEHADENDFLIIVEYPDGESAPIPIRRVSEDSLQS